MNLWQNQWARASVGLFFGVAVFTSAVGLATRAYMEMSQLEAINKAYGPPSEKIRKRILKDLVYLQKHALFPSSPRQNNAAPWIEQHLTDDVVKDVKALQEDCRKSQGDRAQHQCLAEHSLVPSMDVTWMSELQKFDHWSALETPEIQARLRQAGQGNYMNRIQLTADLPTVKASPVLTLALIHFLKTKDKDLAKAYTDYWHVLRLFDSNHSLVSSMIAVKGLEIGVELQRDFPHPQVRRFDPVAAAAYKRLTWAWVSLLDSVWSQPLDPEFAEFLRPELGLCTGAGEQPYGILAFHDLLADSHWPFEMNFTEPVARMKTLRLKVYEICHMKGHRVLLAPDSSNPTSEFQPPEASEEQQRAARQADTVARTPYLRRIIWGILVSIGSPNYYRRYEDAEYEKATTP